MLNIIKLEIKKFKLEKLILSSLLLHLTLIGIILFLSFIFKMENEPKAIEVITILINSLGKITFSIFSAVIFGKIIIDEYTNKTISLMFIYPINRKKLLISKILIGSIFTFINIILSKFILALTMYFTNSFFNFFIITPDKSLLSFNIFTILLSAFLICLTNLIPLYIGMKKKSVPVMMIISLFLTGVMHSSNSAGSLSAILPLSILVAIIGIILGLKVLNCFSIEELA